MKVTDAQIKRAWQIYFATYTSTDKDMATMRAVLEDFVAGLDDGWPEGWMLVPIEHVKGLVNIWESAINFGKAAGEYDPPPNDDTAMGDKDFTVEFSVPKPTEEQWHEMRIDAAERDAAMLERAMLGFRIGATNSDPTAYLIQRILEHALKRPLVLK